MRKTLVIITILIISAIIGSIWMGVENVVLEKSYPLEYRDLVERYSEMYSVPKEIIYAVIKTESDFKSDAVSEKGAVGLMQITPDTYAWLCTKDNIEKDNPDLLYNPEINIRCGTLFLSLLYTEFSNWDTSFAAYNAGRGRVNEWLRDENISKDGILVDIPYKETREYVEKVNNAKNKYLNLYFDKNSLSEE